MHDRQREFLECHATSPKTFLRANGVPRKSYSSHYTLRIESEPNGSSHPFLGGVPISPIQLVALKESGSPTHSKTSTRHAKVPTVRGLRQSRIIAPGHPVPSRRLFTRDSTFKPSSQINLKSSQVQATSRFKGSSSGLRRHLPRLSSTFPEQQNSNP